jgi:enolase
MATIKNVFAREILDSRGNPTIEVDVTISDGKIAIASAPSGASIGVHEVVELRDRDEHRYNGQGVLKAVDNVNKKINPILCGTEITEQKVIDKKMISLDGTKNKSNLGANSIIATSIACAKAAALSENLPLYEYLKSLLIKTYGLKVNKYVLPVPFMNILNGGMHADNNVDIQEFMIVPVGPSSMKEAIEMSVEAYHSLKNVLRDKGLIVGVGDEGGFAPNLTSNIQAIEVMVDAIEKAGYKPGKDICLAVDFAATAFYKKDLYVLTNNKITLTPNEMVNFIGSWVKDYPIISIEDGIAEDDWDTWVKLTAQLGDKTQIVGDDLFTTDLDRLKKGILEKAANAILIKPNQIGTLSETAETIRLAQEAGFGTMISHRSGETEDSFIADLAVASGAQQIKIGAPCRGERVIKYNRLLRIEEALGKNSSYAGWEAFKRFI